jgi:telomerase reverse transcriptase
LADHLNKGIFQQIDASEATSLVNSGKSLGIATMRFLPKSKSLRPIVNMSRRQKIKHFESTINNQLLDCQQVIKNAKECYKVVTGSSVSGLDDIYSRWKKFVELRKQRNDCRPLYFVKADIEDCYNSISQNLLYEIVSKCFKRSDDYIVRKYVSVVVAGGRLKRKFFREAVPSVNFCPSFLEFVQKKIDERKSNNTVFVDQLLLVQMNAEELLKRLKSHIFHGITKVGRRYFKQIRGIGQGSVISTLLCDIYYGKMEADLLTVDSEMEILMRQV